MGVMPCQREGCESILCDRYSRNYGYICNQCFNELVSLGPDVSIYCFMQSVKGEDRSVDALARLEDEFPIR